MNRRRFPLLYLVASWVFGVIGLALGILVEPSIFGRMGSIIVLFALMSEYTLLKQELNMLHTRLENNSARQYLTPSLWHQKKALVTHVTIVVGTLIWGFGDFLL